MSSGFNPFEHLGVTVNPDGSLNRIRQFPTLDPNPDPSPGYPTVSKDVLLNKNQVTARIFRPVKLPSNDNTIARLPIIIYFHGGGFVLYSAADSLAHQNCSQFSSEVPSIVISINYRLAPENKLPAAYEDAVDAIYWVKEQVTDPNGESWLRSYGDVTRCYLSGRGNGATMAYQAALMGMGLDSGSGFGPLTIIGLILNQPMFGGVKRVESEMKYATDHLLPLPVLDTLWNLALPHGADRDHWFCNPVVDGPYKKNIKDLPRCLVTGYNGDPLIDRQQNFLQMLALTGVQVEGHFDDVGFHGVDIVDQRRAIAMMKIVKDFII